MDDLISRQAAIKVCEHHKTEGLPCKNAAISMCIDSIEALPSAQPEIPPYVAEIEAEYKKWINVSYIRKPLAKALYEVWKRHDREDVERRTDE